MVAVVIAVLVGGFTALLCSMLFNRSLARAASRRSRRSRRCSDYPSISARHESAPTRLSRRHRRLRHDQKGQLDGSVSGREGRYLKPKACPSPKRSPSSIPNAAIASSTRLFASAPASKARNPLPASTAITIAFARVVGGDKRVELDAVDVAVRQRHREVGVERLHDPGRGSGPRQLLRAVGARIEHKALVALIQRPGDIYQDPASELIGVLARKLERSREADPRITIGAASTASNARD
jgi:hypothetical protein